MHKTMQEKDRETSLSSNIRKIREEVMRCPICGKNTLRVTDYLYDVPHVGKVIISHAECSSCGYRFTDVRLYESRSPGKIIMPVESPDDLNALVVKSSSASVLIPELGLSMTPGPASEGFITTVEGILERFLEALHAACSGPDANKEACKRAEEEIEAAKKGKRNFTLIIVDPEGVSTVISEKAKRVPVSKEELRELGYIVSDNDRG